MKAYAALRVNEPRLDFSFAVASKLAGDSSVMDSKFKQQVARGRWRRFEQTGHVDGVVDHRYANVLERILQVDFPGNRDAVLGA